MAWLLGTGVAQGYDDSTFQPLQDVTRGQVATLLAGVLDLDPVPPDSVDVDAGATHARSHLLQVAG